MNLYKIIYTKIARDDLLDIFGFISKDNEYYANKVIETITGFIGGLLTVFPHMGKAINNDGFHEITENTFKYKIVYLIEDQTIKIISIYKFKEDLHT